MRSRRLLGAAVGALLLIGYGVLCTPGAPATGTAILTAQVGSSPMPQQTHSVSPGELAIINAAIAKGLRKAHLTPDANGPGSTFCGTNNTKAFEMVFGATDDCETSPITVNWVNNGTAYYLANSSGARVWFHEYANGTGWADCFSHGQLFALQGRDQVPGNVELTSTTSQCTGNANTSSALCLSAGPFAGLLTENFGAFCYQGVGHNNTSGLEIEALTNGTGARVWFHQNSNGSGWAYCYSNNNAYWLVGQPPASAGDLYISSTTSACLQVSIYL